MVELLLDVFEPLLPGLFSLPLLMRGWLFTSVVETRHPLIVTIFGGYIGIMPPGPAIFSSSVNVLGGRRDVAAPPAEWYCGLHGPVVPPVGAAPI